VILRIQLTEAIKNSRADNIYLSSHQVWDQLTSKHSYTLEARELDIALVSPVDSALLLDKKGESRETGKHAMNAGFAFAAARKGVETYRRGAVRARLSLTDLARFRSVSPRMSDDGGQGDCRTVAIAVEEARDPMRGLARRMRARR